jgi:DNA-binding transcriptional MocR family regulator
MLFAVSAMLTCYALGRCPVGLTQCATILINSPAQCHFARHLRRMRSLYPARRALSFSLSKDATLAGLAYHLDQPHLHGWHDDLPPAMCLKFAIIQHLS